MLGLGSLQYRWRNRNPDGEIRQGISATGGMADSPATPEGTADSAVPSA